MIAEDAGHRLSRQTERADTMDQRRAEADPRAADFLRAGEIRTALFLPQYMQDPATGALRGLGTGHMATEITRALAERLGITARIVGYPTPASVVDCLKSGAGDMAFMGIAPSRTAVLDFTPPIFEFDYTFLVPAGSTIQRIGDADRPEVHIAIVHNHASALALGELVKHARLIGAELPDAAFDTLRTGGADALACPRDVLLDYCEKLPGSRVLDDGFGVNRVGIAIRKDQADRLAYLGAFVEEAKASGLIRRAIDGGALRGFRVAP
jgi:polar amino acid transport system substrate-binding protein